MLGEGHVDVVNPQWELMGEEEEEEQDEGEEDRESLDPIEGCTKESFGRIKIAAVIIDAI